MISHRHKCIYIHIPKAAGTSIIEMLSDPEDGSQSRESLFTLGPEVEMFHPPPPHLAASDYVSYAYVTQACFDEYFKFAFVRNPWDRLVSEYNYRRYGRRFSFKEFLLHHFPKPYWSDKYCHVIPQYNFLYDHDGNQLVDFVGHFESLQEDFDIVGEKLGLASTQLPHENKSMSIFKRRDNNYMEMLRTLRYLASANRRKNTFAHYTEYYDNETVDLVYRLYKKDIETFHYDFAS